jgi:hypothetical protein
VEHRPASLPTFLAGETYLNGTLAAGGIYWLVYIGPVEKTAT